MARRAGQLAAGYDQVRAAIAQARPAFLIEASDGAADGRAKLAALWRAKWDEPQIVAPFTAAELGEAIGRDRAVHLAVSQGGLADRLRRELDRLSGFRDGGGDLAATAENG